VCNTRSSPRLAEIDKGRLLKRWMSPLQLLSDSPNDDGNCDYTDTELGNPGDFGALTSANFEEGTTYTYRVCPLTPLEQVIGRPRPPPPPPQRYRHQTGQALFSCPQPVQRWLGNPRTQSRCFAPPTAAAMRTSPPCQPVPPVTPMARSFLATPIIMRSAGPEYDLGMAEVDTYLKRGLAIPAVAPYSERRRLFRGTAA